MTPETSEELVQLYIAFMEIENLKLDLAIKDTRIKELKEALENLIPLVEQLKGKLPGVVDKLMQADEALNKQGE